MTERCHEKGIVPGGALDLAAYGCAIGVGSKDVEGEPTQNGEVLGRIVLSRAIAIFGKMDVEHPMESVFDTPVDAGDVEQSLGGDIFGQQIMAHDRRIGTPASQASAQGNPAHRNDARKTIAGSQAGVAHDSGTARFVSIVTGRVDVLGEAALAGARELLHNRREQAPRFALIART